MKEEYNNKIRQKVEESDALAKQRELLHLDIGIIEQKLQKKDEENAKLADDKTYLAERNESLEIKMENLTNLTRQLSDDGDNLVTLQQVFDSSPSYKPLKPLKRQFAMDQEVFKRPKDVYATPKSRRKTLRRCSELVVQIVIQYVQ